MLTGRLVCFVFLVLAIIGGTFAGAASDSQKASAAAKFDQNKAKAVAQMDEAIKKNQETRACVQKAQTTPEVSSCLGKVPGKQGGSGQAFEKMKTKQLQSIDDLISRREARKACVQKALSAQEMKACQASAK